jgi:type IV secretion system protein VirB2
MKLTMNTDKITSLAFCLFAAYAAALLPVDAMATAAAGTGAGGDTIGNVLCNVVEWFTGKVGQGIATLAIIVIGVGALMGKVSWGMAIIVGIGVAVIFGAPAIVNELGAGDSGC